MNVKRVYNYMGVPLPYATTPSGDLIPYPLSGGEPSPSGLTPSELKSRGHLVIGSDGQAFGVQDTYTPAGVVGVHTDMHTNKPTTAKMCWKLGIDNTNGLKDIPILVFDGNLLRRFYKSSIFQNGYITANGTTISGTFAADTLKMLQHITSNNTALISSVVGTTKDDAIQSAVFETSQVTYSKMCANGVVDSEIPLDWEKIKDKNDLAYRRKLEITNNKAEILVDGQISLTIDVPKGVSIEVEFCLTLFEQSYGMMNAK